MPLKPHRKDLEQSELQAQVNYDPNSGLFTRRTATGRWGRSKPGTLLGIAMPKGYIQVPIGHRKYLAHRLAWLYMTGAWPSAYIDHIDGDRANNRWANLRDVPANINCQNRKAPQPYSRSGVLGVTIKAGGEITANIKRDGRSIYLGSFREVGAAKAAYEAAKRALHPGYVP